MAKRAARKAKLTAPPAAGPALTAAMTPEQRRRDRELNFLNLRPDVLPQGLLVRYRTLLNRRIEMLTTDNARYEHDLARRTAIGRVIQERIKEGIDYKSDLEIWHSVLKIDDLATWRAKREEHTAWIVQELEKKSGTTRNKGFNVTVEGKLAAYRDLLNVTLTLSNRGGIPKGAEPWLWTSLSSDAASRRGDGDDRAFASWALAAKQAVNYIAACRREAGVVGEFEQTHRHRGHVIEVLASWTKEDLEQEEWVCRDDGEEDDEEDEEILEESTFRRFDVGQSMVETIANPISRKACLSIEARHRRQDHRRRPRRRHFRRGEW